MIETQRVLHFSAFIIHVVESSSIIHVIKEECDNIAIDNAMQYSVFVNSDA